MTVAELIEKLKECPQDGIVFAEGVPADKVCIEESKDGFEPIVRIIESWKVDIICPAMELYGDDLK